MGGPARELVGVVRAGRVARRAARDDEARGSRGRRGPPPAGTPTGAVTVNGLPGRQRVPGGLDGVGVAAHRARCAARRRATARRGRRPRTAGAAGPPGAGRPTATARGRGPPASTAAAHARGQRARAARRGPVPPLLGVGVARARAAPGRRAAPRCRCRASADHGQRRRERARGQPGPGLRAEHRPVQRLGERPQEARVEQRRRRVGGQVPVEAGQQARAASASSFSNGPSPASSRAPAARLQGHRVRLHPGQLARAERRSGHRRAASGAARPATAGRTCRRCTAGRRR